MRVEDCKVGDTVVLDVPNGKYIYEVIAKSARDAKDTAWPWPGTMHLKAVECLSTWVHGGDIINIGMLYTCQSPRRYKHYAVIAGEI